MRTGLMIGLCLCLAPAAALAETLRVQVRDGQVRERPSALGRLVATVPYATGVETLAKQGAWTQVRLADGRTGWMSASALTEKRLVVRATTDAAAANASADDVALAGKGFNESVEGEFKKQNPAISFAEVDKMVKDRLPPERLQKFITDGGLAEPAR